MSKLEALITTLCPDGVDYLIVGDVCKIYKGKQLNKELLTEEGKYPAYNGGITHSGFTEKYNVDENTIIISQGGASAGFVNFVEVKFWANAHCYYCQPNETLIVNRYLFHFLKNKQEILMNYKHGAGIPALNANKITGLKIPLPPLPVQEEIVRILDSFTELTAELNDKLSAELTARQAQYEYYRDQLLTFDDKIPMCKLGEIATNMYRGSGIKRDEINEDGRPCVRYGEIYTTYNIWFDKCVSHTNSGKKTFGHGDILFAITGESVEEIGKSIAYVGHEKCYAGGDIVVMKHEQNPKYISYALSTYNAQQQKSKGRIKSKVVHTNIPALQEIQIPIPSLEEQARIVAILDQFDALVNDLSSGLPAEIAARQKQYEYYRDQLLSFPEKPAAREALSALRVEKGVNPHEHV